MGQIGTFDVKLSCYKRLIHYLQYLVPSSFTTQLIHGKLKPTSSKRVVEIKLEYSRMLKQIHNNRHYSDERFFKTF